MEKYKQEGFLREQYWDEGKSQRDIAEQFDIYPGLVHYWMDKHNIPTRDQTEETKRSNRVEYANLETDAKGYERWRTSDFDGGEEIVFVARLLAVAEYGFEAVVNKEVHHRTPIPWLNTHDNVVPLDPGTHRSNHSEGTDTWENKETPWRDEEVLRELYLDREMSTRDVAEKLGCDESTVRDWMDKHDIERRSLSESVELSHK